MKLNEDSLSVSSKLYWKAKQKIEEVRNKKKGEITMESKIAAEAVITEETISVISEIGNDISIMNTMAKSVENALDDDFNYTKPDVENLLSSLRRLIETTNEKFKLIDDALSL